MGPPNSFGFIEGCPWCNKKHMLEACKDFQNENSDFIERIAFFMLSRRRNRPPMICSIAPNEHALAQPGQKFADLRPWSTDFTLKMMQEHPNFWEGFKYGNPKLEETLGTDGSWCDPSVNYVFSNKVGFVGEKKRKHDEFDGSPDSKLAKKWCSYTNKVFEFLSAMTPKGISDVSILLYEGARCFLTIADLQNYEDYLKSGKVGWYCLASIASCGVDNVDEIDPDTRRCAWCKDPEILTRCVQVRLENGRVYVSTVYVAEM